MGAIQPLRALVGKDLQLFFSDRRALMLTMLMPMGIASFFALILGGGSGGKQTASKIPIMVVDRDGSPASREIAANLQKDPALAVRTTTEDAARASVREGKTTVALVLPPDFGKRSARAMFAGQRPSVTLLYDPSHNVELQMLRGLLTQQVMQVVSRRAFAPDTSSGMIGEQLKDIESSRTMPPADKEALRNLLRSVQRFNARAVGNGGDSTRGGAGTGFRMPTEIREEAVTASDTSSEAVVRRSSVAHSFAGMGLQGLLFWAIDAGMGILRERQRGIWKRLRAAPLSRGLLLGGKILSTALIALVVLLAVFGFGALVFHLRIEGSALGFAVVCVSTALMASTFGLLIAALGRTEAQSRAWAIPAVLAMMLLGGAWFPTFMLPGWIQAISLAIPSRWAVDGFDGTLWRGLDLAAALRSSLVLLGFAAVFAAVSLSRFRWESEV